MIGQVPGERTVLLKKGYVVKCPLALYPRGLWPFTELYIEENE